MFWPSSRSRSRGAVTLLLAWVVGCEVEIGDECTTPADCSQSEPRLCLTDALEGFPGGYCTLFNCEPGGCPEEAVCVAYRASLSETPECSSALSETRLQRTFCMRSCSSDADCRGGYACVDLGGTDPWGAEVLESGKTNTRVCTLAYEGPAVPEERASDVCSSEPGALPLPSATSTPEPSVTESLATDAGPPMDSGVPLDSGLPLDSGVDLDSSSLRSPAGDSGPRTDTAPLGDRVDAGPQAPPVE